MRILGAPVQLQVVFIPTPRAADDSMQVMATGGNHSGALHLRNTLDDGLPLGVAHGLSHSETLVMARAGLGHVAAEAARSFGAGLQLAFL